jgi:hypothetical protein
VLLIGCHRNGASSPNVDQEHDELINRLNQVQMVASTFAFDLLAITRSGAGVPQFGFASSPSRGSTIRSGLPNECWRGQRASSLTELETCLQADIAWRAANTLLRAAHGSARRGKFRPLISELLTRLPLIMHAALYGLIDGEPGGRGDI